jgi:hypothetical protein
VFTWSTYSDWLAVMKTVALRPAEGEVGAHLRQADAADQLALHREAQHPGITQGRIRADPQIAEHIGPHAVGAAFDAVQHHVGEEALVSDLLVLHVEGIDDALPARADIARAAAGADDVERLVTIRLKV